MLLCKTGNQFQMFVWKFFEILGVTIFSSTSEWLVLNIVTAWKVSKYRPEITPYLDTFHVVQWYKETGMKALVRLKEIWNLHCIRSIYTSFVNSFFLLLLSVPGHTVRITKGFLKMIWLWPRQMTLPSEPQFVQSQ